MVSIILGTNCYHKTGNLSPIAASIVRSLGMPTARSKMAVSVLLLLLLLPLYSHECEQNWTFVDSTTGRGNDISECIFGGPEHRCHSLEYAADKLVTTDSTTSIVIHIIGPTIPLNDTLRFTNVSDVQLTGEDTQIVCGTNDAGVHFSSVDGIFIENLSFSECGTNTGNLTAAIYIDSCKNVVIQSIAIISSSEMALVFSGTYGNVQILDSLFKENGVHQFKDTLQQYQHYYGAVSIHFNQSFPVEKHYLGMEQNSTYSFSNCTWLENNNTGRRSNSGGGLTIRFNSRYINNITLVECTFKANSAYWGGGLYVLFADSAYNSSVAVLSSRFEDNVAESAGGGVDLGYLNGYHSPFRNNILFQDTHFIKNKAKYGGGAAVFAKHGAIYSKPGDTIRFDQCSWEGNVASFSSSVDVSPIAFDTLSTGFLPVPVFTNCNFSNNKLKQATKGGANVINEGSFTVTKFTVQFGEHIRFLNHENSALHVISGTVEFQPETEVLFRNNSGTNGGAIALYGFSSLRFHNGCHLSFINNTALEVGGAIYYHSYDQHDFVSTRACFIQYVDQPYKIRDACSNIPNVTFEFEGNKAYHGGTAIYALSFYPCYYQLFPNKGGKEKFPVDGILCRAHFILNDDSPDNVTMLTAGQQYKLNESQPLHVIPGQKYNVSLSVRDEMKNQVHAIYRMQTKAFQIEHNHTAGDLRLYGEPGQKGNISISVLNFRQISFEVEVSLLQCPPGFFLDETHNLCKCSARSPEHAYRGIEKCNYPDFRAYILQGYWAGYRGNVEPKNLYTAPCPRGFCVYEHGFTEPILLPEKTNLSEFVCGEYRKGVLCGECDNERSVYYHSQYYSCGEGTYCQYGILFYFLSEFIPLAILFTTVTVFDVRFTSGTINGFIFFSQVLDSLSVDANNAIQFPDPIDKLSIGYKIIYGLFNFDFFSVESLSFCLWKQATVLDTLAFKYITTIFGFGFIMCLVCIVHHCQCKTICRFKKKINTRDSVIHGLSAFLVMCYAQCTKVSFQILTSVTLTGEGGTPGPQVSRFGGIPYFQGKHLAYAIPACVCLTTIVAIPPTLLIVFPLVLRLLSFCGLSESRPTIWISSHIWTIRLVPILDSFQACFKDNFRFFAGLYFVYRIAIFAAYAFSENIMQFFVSIEAMLIVMLGFHAVAQPYERRTDNVVDSLMFINLALINGITTYGYVYRSHSGEKRTLTAIAWLQLILIYLPIVGFVVAKIVKVRERKAMKQQLEEQQLLELFDLERSQASQFMDQEFSELSATEN